MLCFNLIGLSEKIYNQAFKPTKKSFYDDLDSIRGNHFEQRILNRKKYSPIHVSNKKVENSRFSWGLNLSEAGETTQSDNFIDISGDNGVLKKKITEGVGKEAKPGDLVKVDYQGQLSNGDIFDSTFSRREPFTFRLGEGKVIKGWEIGIQTMKVGEKSIFKLSPFYGYKKKGIPPIIPPNAELIFDVSLLEIIDPSGNENPIYEGTILGNDSKKDFELINTSEKKNQNFEKNSGFFSKFFFISPFQSQTGEKAPWILNPNITFSLVFVFIFAAYYFIQKLGVIHIGYIDDN